MREREINPETIRSILDDPGRIESVGNGKFYYFGKGNGAKIKVVVAKNREIFTIITVYPL